MSCGCGSVYTLTPGDRLYLSAMVKSLQQRVSALEGGGVSSDLETFIGTKIVSTVPSWALQPVPPETGVTVEVDPTVPSWAKTPNKPTYAVAEITDAASLDYVDGEVAAHANRTDNPHNVTAAQIGAALSSDLAAVAFSGDFDDLDNKPVIPTPVPQVNADWNATSGVEQVLNKPALGTAAEKDLTEFATAAQGAKADSAVQPSDLDDMAYVPDAPADGTDYARKNNTWVAVTPGGGGGGGGLIVLAADLDLYVRPGGNDANDGLANIDANAFKTITGAVKHIQAKYNLAGYTVNVNVADGTYNEAVRVVNVPNGTIHFKGSTSAIWQGNGSSALAVFGSFVYVTGFTFGGATTNHGIEASFGSEVRLLGGHVFAAVTSNHLYGTQGGCIKLFGAYTITGGGFVHYYALDSASISVEANFTVTLTGTPTFTFFTAVLRCAVFACSSAPSYGFSGAANGTKYTALGNGVIYLRQGRTTSFFPGSTAGSVGDGGVYAV